VREKTDEQWQVAWREKGARDGTHKVDEEHAARLAHRSELFGAKRPSALLKDVVAQLRVRGSHRGRELFARLLELLGFRRVGRLFGGPGV
jgi:hypothetical protein